MDKIFLLVLGLFVGLASGQDIGCFEKGECVNAEFISYAIEYNAIDCWAYAKNAGASHFTHFGIENFCWAWTDCDDFSNSTCVDCISGDTSCDGGPTDLECYVPGQRCDGVLLDFTFDVGEEVADCLDLCLKTDNCTHFTYDTAFEDPACILTDGCIKEDCPTCYYGQAECGKGTEEVICGANYNDTSGVGTIYSPRYPKNYPNALECTYLITVESGNLVEITFDELYLENCCDCDNVVVHNGNTQTQPIIGNLCFDSDLSEPIVTRGKPRMLVVFTSDYSTAEKGFKATWRAVPAQDAPDVEDD